MVHGSRGTVLVVGGAGFVGSHAAKALATADFLPVVLDNLSSGHRHAVRYGPFVYGDAGDATAVVAAIHQYRPSAIMHFAGAIEVGEGERNPSRFYRNNVGASIELFTAAYSAGVTRIILSSSAAVYGCPDRLPIPEDAPTKPTSVYGRTKRMVEEVLADLSRASGGSHITMRYFNAAGADADGELGEEHDPESHLIPNVIAAASGRSDRICIFGDDYPTSDETCVRDYVHVSDLAEGHVAALESVLREPHSLIVNLGTGRGHSIREVIGVVSRVVGQPVPHIVGPRRPGDVPVLIADPRLARAQLGFTTVRSDLKVVVQDAWKFFHRKWGLSNLPDSSPVRWNNHRVSGATL